MESPNEFIKRASRRNKILGDLDTSVISEHSEQENLPEDESPSLLENSNKTIVLDSDLDSSVLSASTDQKGDFTSSAASSQAPAPAPRTPLKAVNKAATSLLVPETPTPTSPLKTKLSQLAANYNDFKADIKPSKTKEDYVHGPQRRVSVEPKQHYHYEVPVKSDSHGSVIGKTSEQHPTSPTKSSSLTGHPISAAAPAPYKNKLSQLVEAFNNIQAPAQPPPRYNPAAPKIRPYNHPNPTKKPAHCEIVSGPTFMQSMSYWQNRAHELPFGYRNRVPITKAPPAKRAPFQQQEVRASEPPRPEPPRVEPPTRNEPTTPVKSEPSKLDDTVFPEPPEALKTVKFSPVVVNLPEPKYSEDETPTTPLEPVSSEQQQLVSPTGPSLLDDINQDFTKIHTPRSQRTSENLSDGGTSKPAVTLAYSLSNYRKSETASQRDRIPSDLDVFEEDFSEITDNNTSDEMTRQMPPDQVQQKLQALATSKRIVIDQIQQTEKALRVARHNSYRSGHQNYTQEIDLLHTLSTLTERRRACHTEEGRLSNARAVYYIFPRATLRFTKIAVSVYENLEILPNHYAYLFALVRYNEQVYSSSALYINPMISQGIGSIEFNDVIEVEDVSSDFSMSIEIYGITLIRKDSRNDHRFNIKRIVSSPQPERHSNNSEEQFSRVGQVVIEREDLKKPVLNLSSFQNPLSGKCRLLIQPKLSDPDDNKWSGFVSIYRMVDSKGNWDLCYSKISNSRLNFWKYPEEADDKPPILSINLRDMVEDAKPCSRSTLGFQYDFEIKVVDASDNVIQILLSTAEEKDREQIIKAVNRSFKYIKTWPLS